MVALGQQPAPNRARLEKMRYSLANMFLKDEIGFGVKKGSGCAVKRIIQACLASAIESAVLYELAESKQQLFACF